MASLWYASECVAEGVPVADHNLSVLSRIEARVAEELTRRANRRWQCGQGSVLVLLPDCLRFTLPPPVDSDVSIAS
jgi:hypothetical protein